MTPQEYINWLDGFLSSNNSKELNEEQTQKIKQKLDTVFNKVTPNLNGTNLKPIYENEIKDCKTFAYINITC